MSKAVSQLDINVSNQTWKKKNLQMWLDFVGQRPNEPHKMATNYLFIHVKAWWHSGAADSTAASVRFTVRVVLHVLPWRFPTDSPVSAQKKQQQTCQ